MKCNQCKQDIKLKRIPRCAGCKSPYHTVCLALHIASNAPKEATTNEIADAVVEGIESAI